MSERKDAKAAVGQWITVDRWQRSMETILRVTEQEIQRAKADAASRALADVASSPPTCPICGEPLR